MSKKKNMMGLTIIASLVSSMAFAQMPPGQAAPAMPAAGGKLSASPFAAAPQVQQVAPGVAVLSSAPSGADSSSPAPSMSHGAKLQRINELKAELDLQKVQAELDKFKQSKDGQASAGGEAGAGVNIQAALDQAKKEMAAPATASFSSAPVVDQGPAVTLLSTFSMVDSPTGGHAELKVGDLLVHAKVGDRLPSGDYVKAIGFDSIEVSKSKKSRKGRTIYISASDTATVYGGRARSGQSAEPAAGPAMMSPSGLPPMPIR
jgi:hypothetical protein